MDQWHTKFEHFIKSLYTNFLNLHDKLSFKFNKSIPSYSRNLKPKVSIIIPAFNTEEYIHQCISSVIYQTLKEIEIIIINDGSNDNTLGIIKAFQKNDNRIVLINNESPSGNPGMPRNLGIDIARGEYIGFVDSDDWVDPKMFRRLYAKAKKTNSDLVFLDGYVSHSKELTRTIKYNNSKSLMNNEDGAQYRSHCSPVVWDKIFRKTFIDKHSLKFGVTKVGVDVIFVLKAYYYYRNIAYCNNYYGYHYRHQSNNSVTKNYRMHSNCEAEIRAHANVRKWYDSDNIEQWYLSRINYRKVRSYIYILSLIEYQYFGSFFNKIKSELADIDQRNYAEQTPPQRREKEIIEFQDILTLSWQDYFDNYRADRSNGVPVHPSDL